MRKTNHKKQLGIRVNSLIREGMRRIGREQDVNQGGYCDTRSGVVNFWCGPDDKPECWNDEIKQGALDHPRDYVGGVYFEPAEDTDNGWDLWIDVTPYEMIEDRSQQVPRPNSLSDESWQQITEWVEAKARELHQQAVERLRQSIQRVRETPTS